MMSTTMAALDRASTFSPGNIPRLFHSAPGSLDRVSLGETDSTPEQFRLLRRLASATPAPGDAAKATANRFRDLWAKALDDNPDGPTDPEYDHSRLLDPDYLKSIQFDAQRLVVPGDANASYLPKMISGAKDAYEMPPEGGMSDVDRAALAAAATDWINQSAVNWDPLPPPKA